MQNHKSQLREIFRKKRTALTHDEVVLRSHKINKNFLHNLFPKLIEQNLQKIFSLYIPAYNEVATDMIAQHFIKNKIPFAYPKIAAKDQPLQFVLHETQQRFAANQFYPKILEPISGKIVQPDILILPLLAFDSTLTRLGMGGGFYDRTIEFLKSNKKIITIGLAYDIQRFDAVLPQEKHDLSLDFIASEDYIIFANTDSL